MKTENKSLPPSKMGGLALTMTPHWGCSARKQVGLPGLRGLTHDCDIDHAHNHVYGLHMSKLRFQVTLHPIVEKQARAIMELTGFTGLSEFLESLVRSEAARLGLTPQIYIDQHAGPSGEPVASRSPDAPKPSRKSKATRSKVRAGHQQPRHQTRQPQ
jgi:hypothetical protein